MESGNFARQTEPKNWKRRRCPRCNGLYAYCKECERQIKENIDEFIYDAF